MKNPLYVANPMHYRHEQWISEWFGLIDALVGVLSFGFLASSFQLNWLFYITKKACRRLTNDGSRKDSKTG